MGDPYAVQGAQPGVLAELNPQKKQQVWLSKWHRFLPLTYPYDMAAAMGQVGNKAPHPLPLWSLAITLNLPIWPLTWQSLPWIL